jgi:formylglycine-generating enzyme required for sulfatase activity
MGSDRSIDANARPDELPQHMVTLPSFLIGRYEVTVGQYLVCVEEGACRRPELASANESEFMPVRLVSWTDATTYSTWLDRQLRSWSGAPSGLAAILRGVRGGGEWHVRLPTEAEWERAARGNQGRVYPWGNEKPDDTRANYDATHIAAPTPVGRFPRGASEFGLFDMSGNVWEWTHSRAVKYPYRAADGREDEKVASYIHRVARGGSFQTPDVRAAERNARDPEERKNFIGFRVAIGPPLRSAR